MHFRSYLIYAYDPPRRGRAAGEFPGPLQPLQKNAAAGTAHAQPAAQLAMSFSSIFGAGVAVRVMQHSYKAVDLGLEAASWRVCWAATSPARSPAP